MGVGVVRPLPPPMGVLGAGASSPGTVGIIVGGRDGCQGNSENGEFTSLGSS